MYIAHTIGPKMVTCSFPQIIIHFFHQYVLPVLAIYMMGSIRTIYEHSHIVSNHLSQRPPNKVLQDQTPSVSPAELLLSRETRRTLAQLRTNKSPLLVSYLFSIGDPRHPSPLCPLCLMHDHTSSHLFECKSLPTSLSSLDLWTNPDKVEPFLATWGERLLAAT